MAVNFISCSALLLSYQICRGVAAPHDYELREFCQPSDLCCSNKIPPHFIVECMYLRECVLTPKLPVIEQSKSSFFHSEGAINQKLPYFT